MIITELRDSTFFAEIELARGERHHRASRRVPPTPSPWRCARPEPVPIFAEEGVLEEAGVLFEQDEEDAPNEQYIEREVEQFTEFLDQVRPEDFARGD